MNKENFIYYLKNPDQLSQLTYQELKTLVMGYPYCQNLRFLVAKKSQLDQAPDYEKDLRAAASCVSSRSFLFQKLNSTSNIVAPPVVVKEDKAVDISQLSELKKTTETPPTTSEPTPVLIEDQIEEIPVEPEVDANAVEDIDLRPEAKGDNIPPSKGTLEIKKNETGNRSTELRISSEKPLLTEKPIDPKGNPPVQPDANVVFIEDLIPQEKIIHKKIIKVIQPITPTSPDKTTIIKTVLRDEEILSETVTPVIPEKPIEEVFSEIVTPVVPEKPIEEEVIQIATPPIILEEESETEEILLEEQTIEELPKNQPEILFPVEPAKSTLNDTFIVHPEEEEFEEIFPITFDDTPELTELKTNIPFEITNVEDYSDEIIGPMPSPKSTFNSWLEDYTEKKNSKKKTKKDKKKTSHQKGEIAKKKKIISTPSTEPAKNVKKDKKKVEKVEKVEKKVKSTPKLQEEKKTKKSSTKKKKKEKGKGKDQLIKIFDWAEKQKKTKEKKEKKPKKTKKVEEKKKVKSSKKKDGTKSFARKSIVENEEIASETLAEILAEQGSTHKAIRMYERLSLIFPEKSTFFAKRIEKLKNI